MDEFRRFPKRCRIEAFPMKPVEIVIEEVKIDHEIPAERFVPKIPDGGE